VDVRKQWADNTALWDTERRVLVAFPFQDPCPQESPDQLEELAVRDTPPEQFDEPPVVDRIEVRRYVALDHPEELLAFGGAPEEIADRVHRAAVWSEPEGVLAKVRFEDRFQSHPNSFLNDPIPNGSDAQRA